MDGRFPSRVRISLLLVLAAAVAIMPGTAAADAPLPGAGTAAPATESVPPTLVSSFSPVFGDGTVVGGTQEVTVIASPSGSTDLRVPLGPAPCACGIASVDTSIGSVTGDTWDLGHLDPHASASLVIVWATSG